MKVKTGLTEGEDDHRSQIAQKRRFAAHSGSQNKQQPIGITTLKWRLPECRPE
jgi:hypothetical protein